ncbi:hypothetical protein EXIGLDRAFT_783874 [Exidia glandulosa HHB12029]|uniref:Uncharacterized protein n=1 Tax=Exidia glandulosa HHB12029 TaxID=1314781 RepID=A0A166MUB3_EXIGL|nr:hypothetical protein EXIGLDRAFT_783874 [Exidia glandulosa HHB12029]
MSTSIFEVAAFELGAPCKIPVPSFCTQGQKRLREVVKAHHSSSPPGRYARLRGHYNLYVASCSVREVELIPFVVVAVDLVRPQLKHFKADEPPVNGVTRSSSRRVCRSTSRPRKNRPASPSSSSPPLRVMTRNPVRHLAVTSDALAASFGRLIVRARIELQVSLLACQRQVSTAQRLNWAHHARFQFCHFAPTSKSVCEKL